MKFLKGIVFFIGKWVGGFAIARRFTKGYLRILCYHGFEIEDETSFRPKLFIKEGTFRRRLSFLSRHKYPVVGLEEGIAKLQDGSLPSNAIVITIDDGFKSVSSCAAPNLRAFGFPCTIYVTTYYSQKESPIFRLAVQYLFWRTEMGPVEVCESIQSGVPEINLKDVKEKSQSEWAIIKYGETQCTELERQALCQKLAGVLQIEYSMIKTSRLLSLLNVSELIQLKKDGFDIQLHTHRHNFPEDDQTIAQKEIQENRQVLEPMMKMPLNHFCYPSGVWAVQQRPWLAALGIQTATTCEVGLNSVHTNPLSLKRFLDGENISQLEFEAEVSGFAEILRWLCGRNSSLK